MVCKNYFIQDFNLIKVYKLFQYQLPAVQFFKKIAYFIRFCLKSSSLPVPEPF